MDNFEWLLDQGIAEAESSPARAHKDGSFEVGDLHTLGSADPVRKKKVRCRDEHTKESKAAHVALYIVIRILRLYVCMHLFRHFRFGQFSLRESWAVKEHERMFWFWIHLQLIVGGQTKTCFCS